MFDGPTFTQYLIQVSKTLNEETHWRLGQTYFNVLYEMRPDIADKVRTTALDPYYSDSNIDDFLEWVITKW